MSGIEKAASFELDAGTTHSVSTHGVESAQFVNSFIKQYGKSEYPEWMNEDIFKVLLEAGFTRTHQCCEGVALKLCASDRWEGNMQGLFKRIEIEVRKKIKQEIEDSFKSVDS